MSLQFRSSFPTPGDFAQLRSHHLYRQLFDDLDGYHNTRRSSAQRPFNPRFDIRESEDAYHLDGEIPGIAQEDIDIEFSDSQTLVIKGRTERDYHCTENQDVIDFIKDNVLSTGDDTTTTERKKKNPYRFWANERAVGEFQRTFSFPSRVDRDAVKATLKNGVLSVVVPKATDLPSKKILVE